MAQEPKSPTSEHITPARHARRIVPRSRLACVECRRRKVRCDVLDRALRGCSNCMRDGIECHVVDEVKSKKKASILSPRPPQPQAHEHSVQHSTHTKSPSSGNGEQANTYPNTLQGNPEAVNPPRTAQMRIKFPAYVQDVGKVTKAEYDYLKASDCFTFPPTHLEATAALSFRDFIYPTLPVLEMGNFFAALSCRTNTKIPLLLYHALICAGLAALPSETIRSYGYTSKTQARNSFCSRAKALLATNVERDPIVICQAALLLISCPTNIDRKDAYYWSGIAINYAHTAKLHLPQARDDHLSHPRWIRQRIWATVMMKDIDVCLAIALPVRITVRVPDQLAFREMSARSDPGRLCQTHQVADMLETVLFEKFNLSVVVSAVLAHLQEALHADWSLEERKRRTWTLDTDLQTWEQQLSTDVKASLHSPNTDDRVLLAGSITYSIFLMTMISLHKSEVSHLGKRRTAELTPESPEFDTPRAEWKEHLEVMRMAADEITRMHLHLKQQGLIDVISTIGVAALCAAIGVHLLIARFCTNDDLSSIINKAEQCLNILRAVSGLNDPTADLVDLVESSVLAVKQAGAQFATPPPQSMHRGYSCPSFADMAHSTLDDASILSRFAPMSEDIFNFVDSSSPDEDLFAPLTPFEDFFGSFDQFANEL